MKKRGQYRTYAQTHGKTKGWTAPKSKIHQLKCVTNTKELNTDKKPTDNFPESI